MIRIANLLLINFNKRRNLCLLVQVHQIENVLPVNFGKAHEEHRHLEIMSSGRVIKAKPDAF